MLRDYQVEICQRVREAWRRHRSVMVQMPTGTGKTVVLASLVCEVKGEVLIVAHRRELVEQIVDTIGRMGLDAEVRSRIGVVSVQWLFRHLEEVKGAPQLVVVDEAHHALAATYRVLWERWPKARFLGLTATPCRLNGEGFTDLFEVLVGAWGVKRFQREGWLAGFDYYSIRPDGEDQRLIDSLGKRGADGDFQLKEMREKLDGRPTLERLLATWKMLAGDRKGVVYAIDIEHAEHIAALYRQGGVDAVAVSSKTPKGVRRDLLEGFRRVGSPRVLVNVDLFAEGFDCPDVECIQLARPTLSLAKFLQMVGRGLRASKGKVCCVLLDNVGLYRVFGLPSAERDWEGWFRGWPKGVCNGVPTGDRVRQVGVMPLWLREQRGEADLVMIASHEVMGVPDWVTRDGRTFFLQRESRWPEVRLGVDRLALETQVGRGIAWKGLWWSLDEPERLFRLKEVGPCGAKLYEEENGELYVQQDVDHRLVRLEEVGRLADFWRFCEAEAKRVWPDAVRPGVLPPGAVVTDCGERLVRVQEVDRVYWVDRESGFMHTGEPVLLQRGCLRLLREGERLFVRNVPAEAGRAFRNWEVRADAGIATVGNRLYLAREQLAWPYRIVRRSEDFRMFEVEQEYLDRGNRAVCERVRIVNEWGREPEIF